MTTTITLSPEERERLLDRFPLTDAELDQLVPLAHAFDGARPGQSLLETSSSSLQQRLVDKTFSRDLVEQYIGRLLEATRRNVFLLGFQEGEALYRTAQFLEASMVLLGRRAASSLEQAIWEGGKLSKNIDAQKVAEDQAPTAASLMKFVHDLVMAVEELSSRATTTNSNTTGAQNTWIASVARTADSTVSAPMFRQWIADVAPTLPFVLSAFSHYLLLGSVERLSCPWSLPIPPKTDHVSSDSGDDNDDSSPSSARPSSVLTSVSTAVPLVSMGLHGYLWKSLYQSTEQGLSFHTLQSRLTSFFGPTLLYLKSTKGDKLGYYTEIPWKITSTTMSTAAMREMSDGKDAFLFTLHPVWRRWGRTHEEPKGRMIQYLYGTQQKPPSLNGLSVGGVDADTPRLHLTTSLEGCKAISIGRSFQNGLLLGSPDDLFFDVEEIQLYAVAPDIETLVGGEQIGQRALETKEALRQKLAHVDKRQFVDDLIFLPGHLYEHRAQARGRADFVTHNDPSQGYYINEKPPSPHVRHHDGS